MSELSDEMVSEFAKTEGGLLVYAAAFLSMLSVPDPVSQHTDAIALLERLAGVDLGEVDRLIQEHKAKANNLDLAVDAVISDGIDAAARGARLYVSWFLHDFDDDEDEDGDGDEGDRP